VRKPAWQAICRVSRRIVARNLMMNQMKGFLGDMNQFHVS
jgi:hypothetical protein